MPNPESKHATSNTVHGRPGDPCVFVIFGATGDLTKRLLIPSLYNLLANKLLPMWTTDASFVVDQLERLNTAGTVK